MKVLCVGGTFDNENGTPSGFINKMCSEIKKNNKIELTIYNGGNVHFLHNDILNSVKNFDVVMWFPNVSNEEEKTRDVKAINPKTILVTSKRNDNNKYTFAELISRSLSIKSNLTIEFSKNDDGLINSMLFDPLGVMYYNGTDITELTNSMVNRLIDLTLFTRVPTNRVNTDETISVPNEEDFFKFAHECADIFHNLVRPAKGTDRFLGNLSFRCQNGFPSFRGENNTIFVSRRNVDKSTIDASSFIATYLDEDLNVMYYGDNKPSVDTPVQLTLYTLFPWVKYMLHAHCYIDIPKDFTDCEVFKTTEPIPCGAIEEVGEISTAIEKYLGADKDEVPNLIAVNLVGHGCLLMAKNMEVLNKLKTVKDNCFISRPMPEKFSDLC